MKRVKMLSWELKSQQGKFLIMCPRFSISACPMVLGYSHLALATGQSRLIWQEIRLPSFRPSAGIIH